MFFDLHFLTKSDSNAKVIVYNPSKEYLYDSAHVVQASSLVLIGVAGALVTLVGWL